MFGFLFKPSSGILWALVNVPVFFSLFSVLVCVCFFYLLLPFLRLINFNFFVVLRYDAVASGAGTDADAFFRLSSLALSLSLSLSFHSPSYDDPVFPISFGFCTL